MYQITITMYSSVIKLHNPKGYDNTQRSFKNIKFPKQTQNSHDDEATFKDFILQIH